MRDKTERTNGTNNDGAYERNLQARGQLPIRALMIWFFQRIGERLQCELRPSPHGSGYELVWSAGDGRTHVEHSTDPEELLSRLRALENWLKLDGWIRHGRVTPVRVPKGRPQWTPGKFEAH